MSNMKPEKKDVWGLFNEKYPIGCFNCEPEDRDSLKSFIKTHFIPRAEVVERVKKMPTFTWHPDGRAIVLKDDLLDLLTQQR